MVFHTYACTNIFLPCLTLSQRSSQVCICHLIVPFSSPILFLNMFAQHISQAHQRIFGSTDFVVLGSSCCVWGPGPAFCLGLGEEISAVHQAVGAASDALHPSPPLHFCKWGNLVPICIFSALL